MKLDTICVTFFGAGLSPKAPGTMGSLAALPAGWLIHYGFGMTGLILATVIAFFGGWWVSAIYMKRRERIDDPQEIVIDEVAGVWFTLCIMPLMYLQPADETVLYLFGAAFVAFRIFDIWKPWPVSLADRKVKGALGVMLDDMLASVYAALLLGALGHAAGALGLLTVPMHG